MLPATPPTEVKSDLRISLVRSGSSMNDSDGTAASLFFQQPTTQLDASSSSWTFNHDGHFLVDSNLGRWNLQQQEKEELRGLFSDSREASLTLGATHKLVKQADCDEIQAVVSSQRVPEGANVSSFTSPKRMESFTGHKGALALASLLLPRERGLSSRPSLSSSPGFFFSGSYPLLQPVDVTHDDADAPRIPKRMPSLLDGVEIQALFSQLVPEDANVSSPTIMPKRMESLTDYDDILAALSSLPPPQGRGGLSSRPSLSSSPGFFFSGSYPLSQPVDATHHDAAAPPIPKRMPSLLDCVEIQALFSQLVPEDANVSSPTMPKRMESLTDYDDILAALSSLPPPQGRGGLSSRPSLSSSPGFFFSGAYPLSQPVDTTHDAAPPRIPKRMPSLFDCVEIQAVFSQLVPEDANVSSPTMPKRMESLTDYDYILAALPSLPPPQGRGLLLPSSSPGFFFSGANPPRIPFRRKSIMMLDAAQK